MATAFQLEHKRVRQADLEEIERDADRATAYLGLTSRSEKDLMLIRLILKVEVLEEKIDKLWGMFSVEDLPVG